MDVPCSLSVRAIPEQISLSDMISIHGFREYLRAYYQGKDVSPLKEVGFQIIRDLPAEYFVFHAFPQALQPKIIDRKELEVNESLHNKIYHYESEERISISVDKYTDLLACHRKKIGEYELPQPFVCEVNNAIVYSNYPIAVSSDGRFITEAVGKPRMLPLNIVGNLAKSPTSFPRQTASVLSGSPVNSELNFEKAVILYNKWSRGYAHWLQDDLPRLQGLREYERRTGEKPPILFDPNPTEFQLEFMELLGFDRSRLVPWDGRLTSVDSLIIPSARRYEIQSPNTLQWLRNNTLSSIEEDDSRPERLFVSRSDASRRRIINQEQVTDLLQDFGFQKIVPTEHSVQEQIAMFNHADVIIGLHGANLSNAVFSSESTLIEIFGSHTHPVQFVTANLIDIDYRAFQAQPIGIDVNISIERLENTLEDVC